MAVFPTLLYTSAHEIPTIFIHIQPKKKDINCGGAFL